jgi:hypothetical protein
MFAPRIGADFPRRVRQLLLVCEQQLLQLLHACIDSADLASAGRDAHAVNAKRHTFTDLNGISSCRDNLD